METVHDKGGGTHNKAEKSIKSLAKKATPWDVTGS